MSIMDEMDLPSPDDPQWKEYMKTVSAPSERGTPEYVPIAEVRTSISEVQYVHFIEPQMLPTGTVLYIRKEEA